MSIVNFSQQLQKISALVKKNTQDLHDLKNNIEGVQGPMDQLIAKAEQVGSAVANIGGQMTELVSLNQSNWTPALEGVVWQLYEVQKVAKETETVSRDILDQIVPLIDSMTPHFELWLKKILQMGADGELTLEQMQQKIDDFVTSVGATQLNSMFHDDLPGFVIEFRKLMEEIKRGEKTLDEAGAALDEVTGKAKKAAEEVRNATGGMTSGTGGGGGESLSVSSTSLGDPRDGVNSAMRMNAAIQAASRR